ncbi:MAG: hypothetical protein J7539_07695 [Niabella sp.]|nr:hypothetical protein [Niabella sp.]
MYQNKHSFTLAICMLVVAAFYSCKPDANDFQKYQGHTEIIYTGTVTGIAVRPGNLRAQVQWAPTPDPNVTNYVLYWNNGADSAVIPAVNIKDTIKTIVTGLQETSVQNFLLYTINGKGNRSIGQTISSVKVLGPIYQSSLYNRQLNAAKPYRMFGTDSVRFYFTRADSTLIYSKLWYRHQNGTLDSSLVKTDSITLMQFSNNTKAAIRSFYLPATAIDTFSVPYIDSTIAIH